MLGVAIGTLIRNQVGAIVALAAYAIVVDGLLFAALPSLARYLPGKAGDALTGRPVEDLLAPGTGRPGARGVDARLRRRGDPAKRSQRRLTTPQTEDTHDFTAT